MTDYAVNDAAAINKRWKEIQAEQEAERKKADEPAPKTPPVAHVDYYCGYGAL